MSKGNWYQPTPKVPCDSLPTTMGFLTLRALLTGLDLEMAGELHCTLVAWLLGEMQGTGSLAPMVATAFNLSPSLKMGFCSSTPPMTLAKLSTSLGDMKSDSPQVLPHWLSLRIGCVVCYVCTLMLCLGFKFCYRPRKKMSHPTNSILQLKGGVWTEYVSPH